MCLVLESSALVDRLVARFAGVYPMEEMGRNLAPSSEPTVGTPCVRRRTRCGLRDKPAALTDNHGSVIDQDLGRTTSRKLKGWVLGDGRHICPARLDTRISDAPRSCIHGYKGIPSRGRFFPLVVGVVPACLLLYLVSSELALDILHSCAPMSSWTPPLLCMS